MNLPVILFGFVLSSMYAAAFHAWRGGSIIRLVVYLILSWVGFSIGQVLGENLAWSFGNIGALYVVPATLGSLVLLALGYWLGLNRLAQE